MSSRFSVTRSATGGGTAVTLVVAGQIDMSVSPGLWDEVRKPLAARQALRVDLRDVTYIDSSGIAVLVRGLKLARSSSLAFALVEPSKPVLSVLDLANLRDLFAIEDSRTPPP